VQMEKDLNSHRKATGFSKGQDKVDALAKKASSAKADHQTSVNGLNDYQRQYYQTHIPAVLKVSFFLPFFLLSFFFFFVCGHFVFVLTQSLKM